MAAPKNEPKIYVGLVLDFETGDLNPQTGACTQIAITAVRLDTFEVIDKYVNYIYPYNKQNLGVSKKKTVKTKRELEGGESELMDYTEGALTYSDIKMDTLYNVGVDINVVAKDIIEFTKKNTLSSGKQCKPMLIGQNITFDIGFLQQLMNYGGQLKEFEKVFSGITDFYGNFQPHCIDTIHLGRLAFAHDPNMTSYKLEILAEQLGVELDDAHDADADVTATLNVTIACAKRLRNSNGGEGDIAFKTTQKTREHFKIK